MCSLSCFDKTSPTKWPKKPALWGTWSWLWMMPRVPAVTWRRVKCQSKLVEILVGGIPMMHSKFYGSWVPSIFQTFQRFLAFVQSFCLNNSNTSWMPRNWIVERTESESYWMVLVNLAIWGFNNFQTIDSRSADLAFDVSIFFRSKTQCLRVSCVSCVCCFQLSSPVKLPRVDGSTFPNLSIEHQARKYQEIKVRWYCEVLSTPLVVDFFLI